MQVPLDRSGALAGQVSLCVQRRPSSGPRTGAVLALAGGPGQAASVAITDRPAIRNTMLRAFAGTADSHDFVVFDQRGTRRSGYLSCVPARARPPRPSAEPLAAVAGVPEQTRRCARKLGARRAFYTTFDSVEDIESVRRAIGVDQLTLFGVSYGTKVAVDYARRYPAHVERLVLDSVLDPDGPDFFNRDSIAALPRVLAGVCQTMCRGVTGDPVGELSELVSRLVKRRLRGKVGSAFTGGATTTTVGRSQVLEDLMFGDLDPVQRAGYPAAVHAALRGDAGPLLRLHAGAVFPGTLPDFESREFSDAVFKAALCEEVAPPCGSSVGAQRAEGRRLLGGDPNSVFFALDRHTAGSGAY
ncbi:MAG TPA: alpha/beta fold hydrolase, partial [Thermoleophilaceae bacterium]|nr:alpha/beta fold hydrolase [Thermoleophilaceae bacterium]